jgi:PDZ domain-containing protein
MKIKRPLKFLLRHAIELIISLLIIFLIFSLLYHVNDYAISPGAAVKANNLVQIGNLNSHMDGSISLVYVLESNGNLTLFNYLIDKFNSDIDILPAPDVTATSHGFLNANQLYQENQWLQKLSQIDAEVSAFKAAGKSVSEKNDGALIGWVDPTAPAIKLFKTGEKILAINNKPTSNYEDLVRVVSGIKPDSVALFKYVNLQGQVTEGSLKLSSAIGESGKPIAYIGIGIIPQYNLETSVKISDDVNGSVLGGPSAGLAYALVIYDKLTGGNLLGNKSIAATGEISADGYVGAIGGLKQKAIAVKNAGDSVFLVPEAQGTADIKNAEKAVGQGLKIISVSTLEQAIDILRSQKF